MPDMLVVTAQAGHSLCGISIKYTVPVAKSGMLGNEIIGVAYRRVSAKKMATRDDVAAK